MARRRFLSIALFLLLGCPLARGQSADLAKQLKKDLSGKILVLRSFSKSSHLQFDSDGKIKDSKPEGSWTLYAGFEVKDVEVARRRLRLVGTRIIYHRDLKAKTLTPFRTTHSLEIDLETMDGLGAAELTAAVSQITVGREGLSPYVPEYWRRYLESRTDPKPVPEGFVDLRTDAATWLNHQDGDPVPKPLNSGGIKQPDLVTRDRPLYPEEAKQLLFQGVVILEAQILETGSVGKLEIIFPAGAGFDENAMDAVSHWKYQPLIVGGKPTPFMLTITVNYAFSR
jgi:TonB family protein